jgi:hypothetical protein
MIRSMTFQERLIMLRLPNPTPDMVKVVIFSHFNIHICTISYYKKSLYSTTSKHKKIDQGIRGHTIMQIPNYNFISTLFFFVAVLVAR